ncbi:unnamed protein product [Lampetra planeri]
MTWGLGPRSTPARSGALPRDPPEGDPRDAYALSIRQLATPTFDARSVATGRPRAACDSQSHQQQHQQQQQQQQRCHHHHHDHQQQRLDHSHHQQHQSPHITAASSSSPPSTSSTRAPEHDCSTDAQHVEAGLYAERVLIHVCPTNPGAHSEGEEEEQEEEGDMNTSLSSSPSSSSSAPLLMMVLPRKGWANSSCCPDICDCRHHQQQQQHQQQHQQQQLQSAAREALPLRGGVRGAPPRDGFLPRRSFRSKRPALPVIYERDGV